MSNLNDKLQGLMKNKAMLIGIGAVGVVLLFNPFSWGSSKGSGQPVTAQKPTESVTVNTEQQQMANYEKMYEDRLTEILDDIRGVSDAKVMVTIDSSEEMVYAQDEQENRQTTSEQDKSGGNRTVTTIDKNGKIVMTKVNGADQPVLVKTIKPRVRGVVVVANGAEEVKIQALITEAVQRSLEVPPHKISILPKKS
ncbi:stage III sporulation protein AG [Tumebacillus sp. ITR2]|uniref:Stage III sporulation protein AG n=1 Tax=Tumebacillus amylolyticus TaxID=2801339 RepID=A0ABS1JD14_9BACL|nr:stage III sporulation protein AG [Tumebacillus amylolyticus]MBL0388140.1 stage III sporulation protein AG [Tumebacillus amylolyticus]